MELVAGCGNTKIIQYFTAATIFGDIYAITIYDESHSKIEHRYVTIGTSSYGVIIVVCHTDRNNIIRIISARKATTKERKEYEEGI